MKKTVSILLSFIGAASATLKASPNTELEEKNDNRQKPNVIIILTDDQGYGDLSCNGNPVLKTPAIDRLQRESFNFTNFHVAPLSTPTRGQLITGMDALRNGAASVLTGRNLLRRELKTLPQIFKENEYSTGIFGKWHLGDNFPDRPMDRGFNKCIWHKGWGLLSEAEFDNDYFETRYLDSLKVEQSGEYCTNLWFSKAIEWMSKMHKIGTPFFAYIPLNSPHGPYHAPAQDYNYYKTRVKDSTTAAFLGMIKNIDRNFERLERWLDSTGLKNNTIVIFMNDNGGTGGVDLYNAGMRDKKGSYYEGGHRAICFLRWPGGEYKNPREINYPAQVQDILPTLIDMLQLKASFHYKLDGESLINAIKGKESKERMFVVQYGGNTQPVKSEGCVVYDNWRLVGGDELYNILDDPGQTKNVASYNPLILKKMQSFYEKWWNDVEVDAMNVTPVIIGSAKENPVIFNSNNWIDNAVNTQWNVALAKGPLRGGTTLLQVENDGKYIIEISRWPFHINRHLNSEGPGLSVGGSEIRRGKALNIATGSIKLNEDILLTESSKINSVSIRFTQYLKRGLYRFKSWFTDSNGIDICGSYYTRIEIINN